MLNYSLTFLPIAIIAGLLGFGAAAFAASVCFALGIVLCLATAFRLQEKMIRAR